MAYMAPAIHTLTATDVTNASRPGGIRVPATIAPAARMGNQATTVRPSARSRDTRTPSRPTTVIPHSHSTSPPRLTNELAIARMAKTHKGTKTGRVKIVGSSIRINAFRLRCSTSCCRCSVAQSRSADDTDGRSARIR